MKNLYLLLVLSILSIVACKKDSNNDLELLRHTWEITVMNFGSEKIVDSGTDKVSDIVNGEVVEVEIKWYTKARLKFEDDGDVEFVFIEGDDKFGEEESFFLGKYTLTDDRKLTLDFAPSSAAEYEGVVLNFDCSIDVLTESKLEFDGQLSYGEDGVTEIGPVQVIAERK